MQHQTTEHLLAAIKALDIDNITIEINNSELPILDESKTYIKLKKAGIKEQSAIKIYKVNKPIYKAMKLVASIV